MICAAMFEALNNLNEKKLKEIEMKFDFQKPI